MRTFISVEPSKEAKDYLFELAKTLKKKYKAKVGWVHKKNLHLTLKFLGEMTEDKTEKIRKALTNVNLNSFEVKLTELNFFPSESNPKIIYIDITPKDKLLELQRKIDEETISYGKQDQEFQTHLTLGRIKQILKKETLTVEEIKPIKFKVDSFTLYQSKLTKDGPKYKAIQQYQLKEE
jgi:RNA 2',3'-cyclic 3'-phosphodiesterase